MFSSYFLRSKNNTIPNPFTGDWLNRLNLASDKGNSMILSLRITINMNRDKLPAIAFIRSREWRP